MRPYRIANSLTLVHHVSYGGTHSANSQPFAVYDAEETERTKGRRGQRKTEFGQDSAVCLGEEAIFL